MKYFLITLFLACLITLGTGFYVKTADEATGDLLIGLSLLVGFFILMPVFIYHRWKDKDIKDYWLTKENIDKMKKYRKEENQNKNSKN